jgi:glycine betaine/proline transport system substrate-binding protein
VDAVAEGRWVIIPLWQPRWLHNRYRIRELHQPKGLPGGTDQATLLVRREAESRISTSALAELDDLLQS